MRLFLQAQNQARPTGASPAQLFRIVANPRRFPQLRYLPEDFQPPNSIPLQKPPPPFTLFCLRPRTPTSHSNLHMMTPDDRSRMEALCAQIAIEKDNAKFSELMQQLIDLLDRSRRAQVDRNPLPVSSPRLPRKGPMPAE